MIRRQSSGRCAVRGAPVAACSEQPARFIFRGNSRELSGRRAIFVPLRAVNAPVAFLISPQQSAGSADSRCTPVDVDIKGVLMKRFGAACAFALAVIGWTAGCNDYGNTFQAPTGASLSSLAPANASAGSAALTLNLFGAGFVPTTVVQWNGKTIPTTVTTDANNNVLTVTATVDASLLTAPGLAAVNTLNPHSGTTDNGLSNTINFIINPPPNKAPTLNSITPNSIGAGSTNVSVTLAGQDFLPTAGTCPGNTSISTQSEV